MCLSRVTQLTFYSFSNAKPRNMSYYKETILKGITELNERSGSSLQAIKKYVQSNLPKGKEYKNGVFLLTIKRAVESGTLVKVKGSWKISAEAKKQQLRKWSHRKQQLLKRQQRNPHQKRPRRRHLLRNLRLKRRPRSRKRLQLRNLHLKRK